MKPNFALSLSFEGIRLLHRAAGGWRIVGDVALDSSDMAGELAVLRRTATALEPGGLRTKLLLPAEQVKFLTIDTPGMDNDARQEAARAALDGATPYAVDDLAFDISAEGDKTHIAAVARETLAEAEGFAVEHRFHPTSFATVPADNPYLGEPFFGQSKAADELLAEGETVEPDGIAVVVIGEVDPAVNDAPVVAPDAEEASAEPADAEPEVAESAPEAEVEAETEVVSEPAAEPEPEKAAEPEAEEEATPEPEAVAVADKVAEPETAAAEPSEPASAKAPSDADPEPQSAAAEPEASAPETAPAAPEPPAEKAADAAPVIPKAPEFEPAEPEPEPLFLTPSAEGETATATAESADQAKAAVPTLPSLGGASRAVPAAPAAPTGFSSRRNAEPAPERREPAVTAASLPTDEGASAPAPVVAAPVAAPPPVTASDVPAPDSSSLAAPVESAPMAVAPAKVGFLSRRKAKAARAAIVAPAAAPPPPRSEAERMTIFGARRDIGGKPRFLGLILTAALLVFLAGVAAWASVFLDDGLSLSRLFGDRAPQEQAAADPEVTPETPDTTAPVAEVQTASLSPTLSEEDTAVLDALRDPVIPEVTLQTPEDQEASYATTGIWPVAPEVPPQPAGLVNIDDLYLASIDPVSTSSDAVALPQLASFATDLPLGNVAAPAAAGTVFALGPNGLVVPTVQGALSPDGYTVYLGRPELIPPATPARFQAVPQDDPARTALAGTRPKLRPGDLSERNERANLDGLTRSELAGLRPRLRPKSVQQLAEAAAAKAAEEAAAAEAATVDTSEAVETALAQPEAAPDPFVSATRLAIKASVRPDTRPRNFARIVKRAQRTPAPQAETRVASTATVAPRVVKPKIPSKTSVARQATIKNAINLRQVNLIGVYGKPSNRRALVRLANGRYKKVVVGDRIDGGQVSAIGNSELRYRKRGRDVVLKMPR